MYIVGYVFVFSFKKKDMFTELSLDRLLLKPISMHSLRINILDVWDKGGSIINSFKNSNLLLWQVLAITREKEEINSK